MGNKQEHTSSGDNVAGNKNEYTNNYYSGNNENILFVQNFHSNMESAKAFGNMNYSDEHVLPALKKTIVQLIETEQKKTYNIVPMSHLKDYLCNMINDDKVFKELMRSLKTEKQIDIENIQVCKVTKDLSYNIDD